MIVEAHFAVERVGGGDPVQRRLDLAPVRGVAATRGRVVSAAQLDDLAAFVLDDARAGDEVGVAQAHFAPRRQPIELFGRVLHEVVALDVKHFGEGHQAGPGARVFGVVDRLHLLDQIIRVILDDHAQRVEHGHATRGAPVEVLAQAVLEKLDVHHAVGLGDADALGEVADGLRRVAAPPQPGESRHTRVVPAAHVALVDQAQQTALAHHRIGQVEAGELDLLRVVDAQRIQEPVIQRAVILEFQRADRVSDALNRVRLPVRPVVHRVDAPGVAGARVLGVQDAVEHGIAQVEVGRGHVNPGPQHARAVGELAALHALEQVEVLGDRAVAVGAVASRLGQCATVLANFLGAQVVHIGQALVDQVNGPLVKLLEVVGGVEEAVFPVRAQPAHVGDDGVYVFLLFFGGVGVVEAQVELAAVLLGRAVVEPD